MTNGTTGTETATAQFTKAMERLITDIRRHLKDAQGRPYPTEPMTVALRHAGNDGVALARRALDPQRDASPLLQAAIAQQRPHFTLEAVVLMKRTGGLFTDAEVHVARRRLSAAMVRYTPEGNDPAIWEPEDPLFEALILEGDDAFINGRMDDDEAARYVALLYPNVVAAAPR